MRSRRQQAVEPRPRDQLIKDNGYIPWLMADDGIHMFAQVVVEDTQPRTAGASRRHMHKVVKFGSDRSGDICGFTSVTFTRQRFQKPRTAYASVRRYPAGWHSR